MGTGSMSGIMSINALTVIVGLVAVFAVGIWGDFLQPPEEFADPTDLEHSTDAWAQLRRYDSRRRSVSYSSGRRRYSFSSGRRRYGYVSYGYGHRRRYGYGGGYYDDTGESCEGSGCLVGAVIGVVLFITCLIIIVVVMIKRNRCWGQNQQITHASSMSATYAGESFVFYDNKDDAICIQGKPPISGVTRVLVNGTDVGTWNYYDQNEGSYHIFDDSASGGDGMGYTTIEERRKLEEFLGILPDFSAEVPPSNADYSVQVVQPTLDPVVEPPPPPPPTMANYTTHYDTATGQEYYEVPDGQGGTKTTWTKPQV